MDTQNQELSNDGQEFNEANLSQPGFLHEGELWFDCPTAAKLMKISESGFYALLGRYSETLAEYIILLKGVHVRPVRHISKKGMIVLANIKDRKGENVFTKIASNQFNDALNLNNEVEAKKKLAERAIDVTTDPILTQLKVLTEMRMQMLGMQEGLDEVRAAVGIQAPQIENHEQRIEGLETYINPMTSKMTPSQRSYLGSRVREYAFHMQAPYAEAWTMLHDFIGKRHVENYTMNDYCVAMGILRNKFKDAKLPWSANEYSNQ